MPVFSLRSQRLSGEALKHRLPENHKLPNEPRFAGTSQWVHLARPNEPSPIFGHFVVGRRPLSALLLNALIRGFRRRRAVTAAIMIEYPSR